MTAALASPSSASVLWYLTRATGAVSLVLLTAVLVLGVLARGGRSLPACPRFVTPALHRNLSLLTVSLLAVHILTAVADPYAPIRLLDAVVPFVSAYRPIWLGLGALGFDILTALIVTSLLRMRLGHRAWRAIHWAAYASWPIAVAHGLGTGTDAASRWLLALTAGAVLAAVAAVLWRILRLSSITSQRRRAVVGATLAVPALLAGLAVLGPLAPNWAARAGTPAAQRSSRQSSSGSTTGRSQAASSSDVASLAGTGSVSGRARIVGGTTETLIVSGQVGGGVYGRLQITLHGRPASGGGVTLSSGSVRYLTAGQRYAGPVTVLQRNQVGAVLTGPAGSIRITVHVTVSRRTRFTGTVTIS